jgi:phosphoenolpyruvate carboxylase
MRAIPWVFSWTQSRYGCLRYSPGGAYAARRADGDVARPGPRYRVALLPLPDRQRAAQHGQGRPRRRRIYDALAEPSLRARIFPRIVEEWGRTREAVLAATGRSALLDISPVLRRSIRLRNPYVDPLSFVQVSLLARLRATPDETLQRLLALTINGIAAGLQSTG